MFLVGVTLETTNGEGRAEPPTAAGLPLARQGAVLVRLRRRQLAEVKCKFVVANTGGDGGGLSRPRTPGRGKVAGAAATGKAAVTAGTVDVTSDKHSDEPSARSASAAHCRWPRMSREEREPMGWLKNSRPMG